MATGVDNRCGDERGEDPQQEQHRDLQEELQQTSRQLQARVAALDREMGAIHSKIRWVIIACFVLSAVFFSILVNVSNKTITSEQNFQAETNQLQHKLEEISAQLTSRIAASEEKIQKQENTLDHHKTTLEEVMYTGTLPFEFTMTEFEKHQKADDEWYSPSFYTHTHGYRMCIRVDANGKRLGKGTHISVFGYLMRGDFDDDLQWPFQGAITIQLLNQLEDSNHHTRTIQFSETADPQCISRVTYGETSSGWGFPIFISYAHLHLNTQRNCQFLKDDQLKFRILKFKLKN